MGNFMVGISEISASLGGIKTAIDLLGGMRSLKTESDINQAVIQIQRTLLDAQASALRDHEKNLGMINKIAELELSLSKLQENRIEKERYKLTEFPTGKLAYVLKEDDDRGDPSHRLCVKCWDEGKRSVLQVQQKHSGGESVRCPNCEEKLVLYPFPVQNHPFLPQRGTSWMA